MTVARIAAAGPQLGEMQAMRKIAESIDEGLNWSHGVGAAAAAGAG
jgi:hypothetical protein